VGSLEEAVAQADVVALLTEWDEFQRADPDYLAGLVNQRLVVDGRHALDADDYTSKGWEYRALGRPYQPRTVQLLEDSRDSATGVQL
jgi:UDPglucose 6-dehydrogenase